MLNKFRFSSSHLESVSLAPALSCRRSRILLSLWTAPTSPPPQLSCPSPSLSTNINSNTGSHTSLSVHRMYPPFRHWLTCGLTLKNCKEEIDGPSRLQSPAQPRRQETVVGFLHDIPEDRRLDSIKLFCPSKEGLCSSQLHKAVKSDGPVSQPLGVVLWVGLFVHVCFDVQVGWRPAISLRHTRMGPQVLSKTSCKGSSKSAILFYSYKSLPHAERSIFSPLNPTIIPI
jgi:hypothetical protein